MKQSEMFNYSVYSRLGNTKKCCPGKQFVETGSNCQRRQMQKTVKNALLLWYIVVGWVIIFSVLQYRDSKNFVLCSLLCIVIHMGPHLPPQEQVCIFVKKAKRHDFFHRHNVDMP